MHVTTIHPIWWGFYLFAYPRVRHKISDTTITVTHRAAMNMYHAAMNTEYEIFCCYDDLRKYDKYYTR